MSIGCDLLISEHLELYSLNFFPVSIPLFNKGKIRHSLVSKNKALSVVICIRAQSYPTLCDAVDCSPPGSVVHGIFLARTLEWVAIFSSRDLPNPGMNTHDLSYLYCRWCLYHWATRKALKLYEMWGNTVVLHRKACIRLIHDKIITEINFTHSLTSCEWVLSHFSHAWLFETPPGSSVYGILRAGIPECVVMPSSRGSPRPRDRNHVSDVSFTGRWVLHH